MIGIRVFGFVAAPRRAAAVLVTAAAVAGLAFTVGCGGSDVSGDAGWTGSDDSNGDTAADTINADFGADSAFHDAADGSNPSDVSGNDIGNSDLTQPDGADDLSGVLDVTQHVMYTVEPDVGTCKSGTVSDYQKQLVLDRVNYIRSLHKLLPVVYNRDGDSVVAACSLAIAANRKLSHKPDSSWTCWSQAAYDGCNTSNIYLQWGRTPEGFSSQDIVDGFVSDENVDTLGHRRWLIDPWLADISFGRVDGDTFDSNTTGAAIRVINNGVSQDISSTELQYVAYPFHEYPTVLYNDNVMMSLTIVGSTASRRAASNKPDYSAATVSVTDDDGTPMQVSGVVFDTEGYGVPNNIRWFADGVNVGVRYNVAVSNVKVDGAARSYEWWFELQ